MAGITDRPFRILCRSLGAGLAASEMLTWDVRLWSTPKSRRRMDLSGEPEPRVVQLAGHDAGALAEAARLNVDAGAQIIDINMGCPAKKVCGKLCGSALLRDESLAARIIERSCAQFRFRSLSKSAPAGAARDRNAVRSPSAPRNAASSHSPYTAEHVRIFTPAMRNTKRFAPSKTRCAFRYSQMAISTAEKKRAQYLISPALTE